MKHLSLCLLLVLGACGDTAPAGPDGRNEQGAYAFETGPRMAPGQNCRACHGAATSPYPEAPAWSLAGTVYEGPDSDVGASGVLVTARDALGNEVRAMSNEVGNFYAAAPLTPPYFVTLSRAGRSVTMAVPPPSGGCNACHSRAPVGGAPGRLFVPGDDFASRAECDGDHTVTVGDATYDCAPYRCDAVTGACLTECAGDCDAGT